MAVLRWIYDLTIFLYAGSVLFYFNDFLLSNRKANRIAFWLLAVVWGLQTVFLALEVAAEQRFPVITLFQTLFFYSWLLVTLSMIINYLFRIDLIVFFTNIIGFTVMVLSMFITEPTSSEQARQVTSELLLLHVIMAVCSYAALSLSMIFSLMYLIQHKMLKKKRWSPLLRRLPSLDQLEQFAYRLKMVGVPMMSLAIILGVIWAILTLPGSFWTDFKIWLLFVALASYIFLLYQRIRGRWQGRRLAVWNIATFALLLFSVLFTNMTSFHGWT